MFINVKGECYFVKFIFILEFGVYFFIWDEVFKFVGQDLDFYCKDLWEVIENGVFFKWKFGIQVIFEVDEYKFDFDILDVIKIWFEDLVFVCYIGEFEFNCNLDEFFLQIEQVVFCISYIVFGIGFFDDFFF